MKSRRVGYVRVSRLDQNADRQLENVEVDRVFREEVSGKDVQRPQLEALVRFVREGDVIVVHSMDRLAATIANLRHLIRALTKRGIRLEFVKERLTFSGEGSVEASRMLSVLDAMQLPNSRSLRRVGGRPSRLPSNVSVRALHAPSAAVRMSGKSVAV